MGIVSAAAANRQSAGESLLLSSCIHVNSRSRPCASFERDRDRATACDCTVRLCVCEIRYVRACVGMQKKQNESHDVVRYKRLSSPQSERLVG